MHSLLVFHQVFGQANKCLHFSVCVTLELSHFLFVFHLHSDFEKTQGQDVMCIFFKFYLVGFRNY